MAQVNGQPAAMVSPGESRLNTNALGLWGLVIMGIAYMGLALTAYFNFGIMEGITGPIVPLAFAAVTVAMLPTAASYAIMNSRRPSTGSTLTWLWEATTPSLGVWLGWVLVIAYIDGCILQPVMFGLFFNSFLNYFGVHAGYLSATLAGLIPILIVGYMTKKDIRVSTKLVGLFIPLRMSDENLEIGDTAEHGHEVYPSDVPSLGYPAGVPDIPTGTGQTAPTPA